jgi:hypothetical protein
MKKGVLGISFPKDVGREEAAILERNILIILCPWAQ